MARKSQNQKEPNLPPERALKVLSQQLECLQKFKSRSFQEADSEKTEWEHLTESIIEGTFGNPSSELTRFFSARNSGVFNLMGISHHQKQENFNSQVQELESLLRALIATLRLQLPEEETKGVYGPGEEYDFYRDLSSIIQVATQDIFFVDAYLDEDLFNLYVSKVPATVNVRILTNRVIPNVNIVAKMFAQKQHIQLRTSQNIHDRHIFLDQRGWAFGQSIKDAATKKPTYMIELNEPALTATRNIHNQIWTAATSII